MKRWSVEEDEKLYGMMKNRNEPNIYHKIGEVLRRSPYSVEARWRWLNITDEQLQAKKKRRAQDYLRRHQHVSPKRKPPERCGRVEASIRVVPDHVFVERRARQEAPHTLTSLIFGDPPKGYSALDRRGVA